MSIWLFFMRLMALEESVNAFAPHAVTRINADILENKIILFIGEKHCFFPNCVRFR